MEAAVYFPSKDGVSIIIRGRRLDSSDHRVLLDRLEAVGGQLMVGRCWFCTDCSGRLGASE